MEKILETEEFSLQYGGVAPVHLSVITGLGDVAARELNKPLLSHRAAKQSYLGLITVDQL